MTTDPNFTDLRRTQRLLLTPKGEISDSDTLIKAQIRNISRDGMLLVCDRGFSPGQIVTLKFQALADEIIRCEVRVRHSSDAGTGVEIVAMGHEHRRAFRDYLQEHAPRRTG